MPETYHLHPVGQIRKQSDKVWIHIYDPYRDGLRGLDGFSHIHVLYWFHENDTPEGRNTLMVHPRKDPNNPLTGVFATHSPLRPNLIALSLCRIISIQSNAVYINAIDARDNSPVIDVKCYIPYSEKKNDVTVPGWVSADHG